MTLVLGRHFFGNKDTTKKGDREGDDVKTPPRKALMTPRQEDEEGGGKKSKPTCWFLEAKVKEGRNSMATIAVVRNPQRL